MNIAHAQHDCVIDSCPREAVELPDEDVEGQVMFANEVSENDVIASYHFVINATFNLLTLSYLYTHSAKCFGVQSLCNARSQTCEASYPRFHHASFTICFLTNLSQSITTIPARLLIYLMQQKGCQI